MWVTVSLYIHIILYVCVFTYRYIFYICPYIYVLHVYTQTVRYIKVSTACIMNYTWGRYTHTRILHIQMDKSIYKDYLYIKQGVGVERDCACICLSILYNMSVSAQMSVYGIIRRCICRCISRCIHPHRLFGRCLKQCISVHLCAYIYTCTHIYCLRGII